MTKEEFKKKINALMDEYFTEKKETFKVRTWEDMENEYGVDEEGDIPGPEDNNMCFIRDMKYLCGKTITKELKKVTRDWVLEDWMIE